MIMSLDITLDEIKEEVEIKPALLSDAVWNSRVEEMFYWHNASVPKYLYEAYEDACHWGCEKQFMDCLISPAYKENEESTKISSQYRPVCNTDFYAIDGTIYYVPMKNSFKSKSYFGYEYCDGRQFIFNKKDFQ